MLALGAATLVFVGVAAAVEGGDGTPPDDSTTTVSVDATVSTDTCATEPAPSEAAGAVDEGCEVTDTTVAGGGDDETVEPDGEGADENNGGAEEGVAPEPSDGQERPANHGAAVSEAARTCPPGPEHGACVSAVARSDAGKPNTDDSDETETGAPSAKPKGGKGGANRGRGPR